MDKELVDAKFETFDVGDLAKSWGQQFIDKLTKSSKQQSIDLNNSFSEHIINPPFDPFDLAHLSVTNIWHSRCIVLKADVAISTGWRIVHRSGEDKDSQKVIDFLNNATNGNRNGDGENNKGSNTHHSFATFLHALALDKIGNGNAYFEVLRDATGKPAEFYHVPSITVRRRQLHGFYQMSYLSRELGETAFTSEDVPQPTKETYNLFGGQVFRRIFFKEYGDKYEYDLEGEEKDGLSEENKATELFHMKDYHPLSQSYGIPPWFGCVDSIISDKAAQIWNLNFFENNRVPRWLFMLTGQAFTQEEKDAFKLYFTQVLKSRPHVPMVLANPHPDSKIEIHKLEVEANEASFLQLKEASRDEIIAAHGVPPRMLGIMPKGQLGGKGDAQKQREDFKSFAIQPLQQSLLDPFNRLILPEAGFGEWEIRLNEFDTSDPEQLEKNADSIKTLVSQGVLTVNEARERLGLKSISEDWANKHYFFQGQEIVPSENLDEVAQEQREEKEIDRSLKETKKRVENAIKGNLSA